MSDILIRAASNGNLAQVNTALHDGGDTIGLHILENALMSAACNGHLSIVELLLRDNRVNPAAFNNEAIIEAARHGHLSVVELLLKDDRVNPAEFNNQAIRDAAENGHIETVNALADWYRARQREIPRTPAIDNILRQRQETNNTATLVFSSGARQGIGGVRGPLQIAVEYAVASPADVVPVSNKVCQEVQRKVRQNLVPG